MRPPGAYQVTGKHPGTVCSSGKVFYRDEWRAVLALANAQAVPDERDPDKGWEPCRSYYRCPECDNWHLTSMPPCERRGRMGLRSRRA